MHIQCLLQICINFYDWTKDDDFVEQILDSYIYQMQELVINFNLAAHNLAA